MKNRSFSETTLCPPLRQYRVSEILNHFLFFSSQYVSFFHSRRLKNGSSQFAAKMNGLARLSGGLLRNFRSMKITKVLLLTSCSSVSQWRRFTAVALPRVFDGTKDVFRALITKLGTTSGIYEPTPAPLIHDQHTSVGVLREASDSSICCLHYRGIDTRLRDCTAQPKASATELQLF